MCGKTAMTETKKNEIPLVVINLNKKVLEEVVRNLFNSLFFTMQFYVSHSFVLAPKSIKHPYLKRKL